MQLDTKRQTLSGRSDSHEVGMFRATDTMAGSSILSFKTPYAEGQKRLNATKLDIDNLSSAVWTNASIARSAPRINEKKATLNLHFAKQKLSL